MRHGPIISGKTVKMMSKSLMSIFFSYLIYTYIFFKD